MLRQIALFFSAGALATLIHYLALIVTVSLGTPVVAASTFGALLGALTNYGLNRRYTFRSRRAHRSALPRYLLSAAFGLALNAALLGLLLPFAPHYLVAQVAATLLVLSWNFTANRYWIFRETRYAP